MGNKVSLRSPVWLQTGDLPAASQALQLQVYGITPGLKSTVYTFGPHDHVLTSILQDLGF